MAYGEGNYLDESARWKRVTKAVTFNSATGTGAIGPVPLFNLTGVGVIVGQLFGLTKTDVVGASGTLALGVTGSTAIFLVATAITEFAAATPVWTATTGAAIARPLVAAQKEIITTASIIGTVATTALSAGVMLFVCEYRSIYDPVTGIESALVAA